MKKQYKKTKFEKHADTIKLRAFERRELRERLISYMEYHPVAEPVVEKKQKRDYISSQAFTYFNFKSSRLRVFSGAFAAIIVLVVPFAAERSVPGDILYPVKVRITEEVREQLSFTGYQKIAWETERVERRIAEARLLASQGRLTEETEAAIGEEVREHARVAQAELEELKRDDADGAAVAEIVLQSALDIQSLVLDGQIAAEKQNASSTHTSIDGIATALREVVSNMQAASNNGSSTPAYASFVGRVEFETTRARELFDSVSGTASADERTEIERRLEDNERAFSEAQEHHEAGDDGRSIATLRTVLANTQKLIAFMTDIDVRLAVAIETLVPKTFTDEERLARVNELLADIRKVEEEAAENLDALDESTAEKATIALEDLAEMRIQIEETLSTEGDLGDALDVIEVHLVGAVTLAEDVAALFVPEETPIEGEFGIIDLGPGTSTATTTDVTSSSTESISEPTGDATTTEAVSTTTATTATTE